MDSCPSIKNILLLDSEGKRVAIKYYTDDWPTLSAKLAFEKSVFTKTQKTNARTEGETSNPSPNWSKLDVPQPVHLQQQVEKFLGKGGECTACSPHEGKVSVLLKKNISEVAMFDGCIVVYKFIQDLHFFVTGGDDENELILATALQGFFDAVGLLLRSNVDKRTALENLDLILLCLDEIVDGGIILETDASVIAGKVANNGLDSGASLSEQTITQALATAREHLARTLLK